MIKEQVEVLMMAVAPGLNNKIIFELKKEGDEYNVYQDGIFVYGTKDIAYSTNFFLWTVNDYDGTVM